MNRVNSNEGTLTNGQPITNDTIPFLEDGVQEAVSNLVKGILGSYNTGDVIILSGVVFTVSGGGNTLTWTAGSVYFNGEIYTVASGTVNKTGGQTFVFTNTEDNGPAVTFEDNTTHYPHRIRQVQLVAGTAGGSGTANYISDYSTSNVKRFADVTWHYVGGSGEPAFTTGWINDGVSDLRFYKDSFGWVYIQGVVKSGTATIFTLPAGLRPDRDFYSCLCEAGTGSARMLVDTTGRVGVSEYINTGSNSLLTIDIKFKAA